MMRYINQLEPDGLIDNFLSHPPVNFDVWLTNENVPAFSAYFNLLTTVDLSVQKKIQKIPFFSKWSRWLQPKTCFIGTTVSEYVLLTDNGDAKLLAESIKKRHCRDFSFVIVKDIPQHSPLQNQAANDFSQRLIDALKACHFIEVEGQALAWVPVDYSSVDDYLSRLSSSRRKNFRRKLKSREHLDITILCSGDDCFFEQSVLDSYYQLYLNVYQQSEIHFDLLTKAFFTQLLQNKETPATIFTYSYQNRLIGYNICFVSQGMLVDKYIGFIYPDARDFNLYFVSWFYNLEYARQQGLKYYVAGWTDPEVKASLGAQFTFTKHMVYVRNPLLRRILSKLSDKFESDRSWRDAHTQLENDKRGHNE